MTRPRSAARRAPSAERAGARRKAARSAPPPVWPMRAVGLAILAALSGAGYLATVNFLSPDAGEEAARAEAAGEDPAGGPVEDPAARLRADPAPGTGEAAPAPPLADAATILAGTGPDLGVWRLSGLPRVLVLDFPTLGAQAGALNRVAALIEKAGLPRGRVVSHAGLEAYVAERGGSLDTFYYGHNYDAAELARFFRLAETQGHALAPAEADLRDLLEAIGAIARGPQGWMPGARIDYLISLARMEDPEAAALRQLILAHEIGHAVFAARPRYRDHVRQFWDEGMSGAERDAFRRFLAERDYDVGDPALVIDEMQAFLVHTEPGVAIDDAALGLGEGALAELRARFLEGLPDGVSPRP